MPVTSPVHLKDRNALRVALRICPILASHGLSDLEFERTEFGPKDADGKRMQPGTLVWRAQRRWKTRKTREWKFTWYCVVHYPRDSQYEMMTDEEYGNEVVRQLDDMLFGEAFAATSRKREFTDKRRHLNQKRRRSVVKQSEPTKPDDWESF